MGRAWRSMIWFRTPRLHSTIPLYHFHFGFRTRCSHCFLSSHLFPPKKDHKQAICFLPWQWHTTQAESFAFHERIFSLWKKDMRVKGPSVWELRQRCTIASHEVGRVPIDARVAWAGGACSAGANWCESEGFVPSSQLEIWNLYPLLQINHVW